MQSYPGRGAVSLPQVPTHEERAALPTHTPRSWWPCCLMAGWGSRALKKKQKGAHLGPLLGFSTWKPLPWGSLPRPPRLCPLGLFLGAVSDFSREPLPPTQGPPQKAASACLLSDLTRDPGSGSHSPRQDSRPWVGVRTSGSSMLPGLWSREARMGTHTGVSEWEEKKPESRGRPGRRKQEPRKTHGGPPSWGPSSRAPVPHQEHPRYSAPSPQSHSPDPSPHCLHVRGMRKSLPTDHYFVPIWFIFLAVTQWKLAYTAHGLGMLTSMTPVPDVHKMKLLLWPLRDLGVPKEGLPSPSPSPSPSWTPGTLPSAKTKSEPRSLQLPRRVEGY